MDASPLTISEFVILGLLTEGDRHAYELDRVIEEREIRSWAGVSFPSLYRVARGLEGRGLVSSTDEVLPGRPKRRLLSVTGTGLRAVQARVTETLTSVPLDKSLISLAMMFAAASDPKDLRDALYNMIQTIEQRLRAAATKRAEVAERWPDPRVDAIFAYDIAILEAERSWARETVERL